MSTVNTTAGFYNVPAQIISNTAATPLLVPASGYAGLPSPTQAAGSGLYIAPSPDIIGSATFDGHPFLVRMCAKVNTAVASSFTAEVRFGTSSTASSNSSIGVTTGSITSFTGNGNVVLEAQLFWDSVNQELFGNFTKQYYTPAGGTFAAPAATTALSVANVNGAPPALTFIPVFTFGSAGANSVTVTEFTIDRA